MLVKAASRRNRARAARALTGMLRSGSARPKRSWLILTAWTREVRTVSLVQAVAQNRRLTRENAHRAWHLSYLLSLAARPGRTSRLLSCAPNWAPDSSSPIPPESSPRYDQTKTASSITGAGSAYVCCSRYAESLATADASRVLSRSRPGRPSDAGRARRLQIERSGAVMSGVGNNGQVSEHGHVDANDRLRYWTDTRPSRTMVLFWTPNRTYNGHSRSQVCLWPRFASVNPQTACVSPIRRVAAARR